MQFSRLPLCSSDEIVRVLNRLGCIPLKAKGGSHHSFPREVGGRVLIGVVVVGKRQVPTGTLRRILASLEITVGDFLDAL